MPSRRSIYAFLFETGVGVLMDYITSIPTLWIGAVVTALGLAGFVLDRPAFRCRFHKLMRRKPIAEKPLQTAPESAPAPIPISADGEAMAKHILLAPDLAEAERLYMAFNTTIPPTAQFNAHFVNKAYLCRLDEAGERDKAGAFYHDVASRDADRVGDAVRFAALVLETREEAEHVNLSASASIG